MKSFEDLALSAELVEALAAEGLDVPTPIQEQAVPVIGRGNSLVLGAGPGAGTLVAYGAPLLDVLEEADAEPCALVLAPTREWARALAESLARLAVVTGHRVAALEPGWALPEKAHFLFGTPGDVVDAVHRSRIKLDGVQALVVDGAGALEGVGGWEDVETVIESVPQDSQRILVGIPVSPRMDAFAEAHLRKAVHVPPRAVGGGDDDGTPRRGQIHYQVVAGDDAGTVVRAVDTLLAGGMRHVLVFCRSDDRTADIGDRLTLHGFVAGAPGDDAVPVWLAMDELEARQLLQDELADASSVATLSVDVPPGPDSLDRRHGAGGPATVLVASRELAHLKQTARTAGYALVPAPEPVDTRASGHVEALRSEVGRTLKQVDLGPWHLVLEPLYERHSAAEVAAALAALLREAGPGGGGGRAQPPESATERAARGGGQRGPAWSRLFISVGQRDSVGPGDLLGAIAGEAGVEGSRVGKIDIRDSYSLVEVDEAISQQVINALNGVTIRGRSVRADYDRGSRGKGRK